MKDSLFKQQLFNSLIQSKSILFFSIDSQHCLNHFSKKFEYEFLLTETEVQNKNLKLENIPEFKRLNTAFLDDLAALEQKSNQLKKLLVVSHSQCNYHV